MHVPVHGKTLSQPLRSRFAQGAGWFLALLLLLCSSAGAQQPSRPLRIAAAADLQPVLPPILQAFMRQTGIPATATYESSSALTAQILNGAEFDLFLSADMQYPARVIAAGLGTTPSPVPYAHGVLVLFTRKDSRWPRPTLDLLRDPQLKRLAIADPARAPYGSAAMAALSRMGLASALRSRLVTAANIAQAAEFVETGNADAGLISQTAAMTPALRAAGSFVVVPQPLYPAITQGAVVLAHATESAHARQLLDFLLTPAMQQQLVRSGLQAVATSSREAR